MLLSPQGPEELNVAAAPSGVGKTELAKALATYLFNSEDNMVRLAWMSNVYGQRDSTVSFKTITHLKQLRR